METVDWLLLLECMAQIINLWFSFQTSLWYDGRFWYDDMFCFEESCAFLVVAFSLGFFFFFQAAYFCVNLLDLVCVSFLIYFPAHLPGIC